MWEIAYYMYDSSVITILKSPQIFPCNFSSLNQRWTRVNLRYQHFLHYHNNSKTTPFIFSNKTEFLIHGTQRKKKCVRLHIPFPQTATSKCRGRRKGGEGVSDYGSNRTAWSVGKMIIACDEEWNWAHKNGGGGLPSLPLRPRKQCNAITFSDSAPRSLLYINMVQ